MNKKFTILTAALALLTILAIPIGMWGQTTVVYAQTSTTAASVQSGTAPTGSSVAFTTTYSNMNQLTEGNSMTLTLSGYEGNKITGITLSMRSNSSKGAGSLSVTAGSTTIASIANAKFNTSSWYGSWSTSYVDVAVTMSNDSYVIQDSENVTITIAATENSLYCNAFKITYESSSTISTTTTIVDSGITNTNKFVSTEAGLLSATVTETTSGNPVDGATVAWSGNNDAVATINASTGVVTLVGAGIVTFTASYAGNATHSPSSNTYELTVTNENPALVTIWSENFSSYNKDDVPSGGTYGYVCSNGGGTTKIYTENNAGGTSPELLVGKTNGAFEATVPLLTSTYGYSGDLTLTFKSNAYSINVKSGTSGITVDGEASLGAGVTFNTKDTHTVTFKGTTVDNENVNIVFTATTGSNVRIDDIVLKGAQTALTKVATPVISPAGGAVVSGTEVTMTCLTDGATIYYTTDGSTPSSSSTVYNSASKPTITSACTIKAIGIKSEWENSDVASATYSIAEPCATPTFSPAAGEVAKGTPVEISTTTPEATIYYTTDGTDPTTSSTVYSSAITINTAVTLKAIAAKDGYANSAVASAAYTVIDYATLPFAYDGNGSGTLPTGLTQSGLGTYASSPKMKFDGPDDYLLLKLNDAPASLSYTIKGNGSGSDPWAGTFKVQTSADGETYDDLVTYTSIDGTPTITHIALASTVRYIKWVYIEKTTGNVALGNINADDKYLIRGTATVAGDITLDTCTIQASGQLTIASGTLNVTDTLANEATSNAWNNLVIKDGGQLKTPNAVNGTIEKAITGYGTSTNGKYVLLATPATMDACNETGMWPTGDQAAQANIDFYSFDQSADQEWQNFKHGNSYFAGPYLMQQGQGYLYANPNDVTLTLQTRGYESSTTPYQAHPFAATNAPIAVPMSYYDSKPLAGYNLLGNPFTCDAYINREYYRMNDAGDAVIAAASATTAIKPCEGIFVLAADGDDNSVTFSTTVPSGAAPANVVINLKESEMVRDRAIVSFGNERNMPRFQFNEAAAKLYIPQGEKEMAKVNSEAQGEMPVNFKADKNGTYTLSIDIDADMDYLHLIDNMTGADVDLLANPSYTFDARTSDYASRFRLVFSANTVDDNTSTGSATFAYFNGSEWVVNSNGNATLQVVDVMGRVLSSETVNGNHNMNLNLSTGVYMLRLVNGNDVKTQKIVVR